jgi:ATP-dependent protease Clp ATPase subunit
MANPEHKCSFCGKQLLAVSQLIVGSEGSICEYCVAMNYIILEKGGVHMVQVSGKVKRDLAKLEPRLSVVES